MLRVGMLTSGGDCQALNATMRGVAKSLYKSDKEVEIIGFLEGYKGLMYEEYRVMKPSDFSGILTTGGTMLETGPYPYELKRRILSERGHLSNENSGKLICEILNENIKKIFLGHLSDKNNLPELALESVRYEIFADERPYNPKDFDIEVAKRDALSEICYV